MLSPHKSDISLITPLNDNPCLNFTPYHIIYTGILVFVFKDSATLIDAKSKMVLLHGASLFSTHILLLSVLRVNENTVKPADLFYDEIMTFQLAWGKGPSVYHSWKKVVFF